MYAQHGMDCDGLSIRDRLRNLHEKLTDSSEHSVMDIAKEARRVFDIFTTNASVLKQNGDPSSAFLGELAALSVDRRSISPNVP